MGKNQFSFAILLMVITVGFLAYWFLVESKKMKDFLNNKFKDDKATLIWFIANKSLGFLIFGIIVPIVALTLYPTLSLKDLAFQFPVNTKGLFIFIVATILALLVGIIKNKRGKIEDRYPEVGLNNSLVVDFVFWALYLLSYEFMFRGVLLFIAIGEVGLSTAIGINIAIYALAHVPKGTQEAFGALLLGLLLCLLTYNSSSILYAWIIHLALAISNDFSASYYKKRIK
jgi:membrane protease YdiL (CAAX protease family)